MYRCNYCENKVKFSLGAESVISCIPGKPDGTRDGLFFL